MPRPKQQHLKRRADGRYCCRYKDKQFFAYTEKEALALREEYKRQEESGIIQTNVTLGEYAEEWLQIHKASVKVSTYNGYATIMEHTIGNYAHLPLQDINTDMVARIYADLVGKSASYIHKSKILLEGILDSAVDAEIIKKNPARAKSVTPPKGTSGTHRAITDEERQLILSVKHRMQIPALIMLYCGLRRSEMLALTAEDIGDNAITVDKAIYYVGNKPILSGTKTEAGKRTVPIPSVLKLFLADLKGIIAKGGNGSYMTEQAFTRAWESYMNTLTKAAGHTVNIRCHDLRHSYATMLCNAGVDIHQAIIWMGHANEKMILRIYDHPGNDREKDSMAKLNKSTTA